MAALTVLHVAPHPDDEVLGAPATLLELTDHGHRVVNLAVGLGRPNQHARRRAEVTLACERAGFELRVVNPPEDPARAGPHLAAAVREAVAAERAALVVSPGPHDRHPAHEAVARAVATALEALADEAPRWWQWGLWADLPFPTLVTRFDERRLQRILFALAAHAGETARNDYRRLVEGRARAAAVLGPERVFGFGSPGVAGELAELVTELVRRESRWLLGRPRVLDGRAPLAEASDRDVTAWLAEPSLTDRFGPPGG